MTDEPFVSTIPNQLVSSVSFAVLVGTRKTGVDDSPIATLLVPRYLDVAFVVVAAADHQKSRTIEYHGHTIGF